MTVRARRRRLLLLALATSLLALVFAVATAFGEDGGDPQPVDFTHNVTDAPAPISSAVFGTAPAVKTGTAICTTATQNGANVNTDCEAVAGPHNETSIAVNPANPLNLIGGANDYQLGLNAGGHVSETVLSRAHVTFDGGRTWSEFPLYSTSAYQATGDPAVAFDASGHAYYATLGFRFVGPFNAQNPDVLVANSGDGARRGAFAGSHRAVAWRRVLVTCSTRSTSLPGGTAMQSSPSVTIASARRARS